MTKRQSVYMPTKTRAVIDSYGGENLSGAIAGLIDRYVAITTDALPELSEAEWSALCDCLNGCGVWLSAGGHDPFPHVWAEVADSAADGLGEKWSIDPARLAEQLRALPLAGRAAVWDVAARFWASPRLNEATTRELLIAAGARIREEPAA